MAYKKKSSRRVRRSSAARRSPARRRRIGATTKSRKFNAMRVLGLVAGAVAPQMLNGVVIGGKALDGKIVGIGSVVVGFLLPRFAKGDLFAGVGDGMIASGGVLALKEFNVLSGIPIIAGWKDMKVINGPGTAANPAMIKGSASTLRTAGNSSGFRPSPAQLMNGMYNRRPLD